jgi:hypothetical protein
MRRSLFRTFVPIGNPGSAQKDEAEIADAILADLTAAGETELINWINRNYDRYMNLIRREYTELLALALSPGVPLTAEAPRADGRTPLYGHTSPETAYFIPDYPGGFRKRLERRDWIEYKKDKGYRWVYQTREKGSSRWNNPKASTYSSVLGLYLDEKGHIQSMTIGYSGPSSYTDFLDLFTRLGRDQLLSLLGGVTAYIAYKKQEVRFNEKGETGMTINGEPVLAREGELERNQAELVKWEQVANRIRALLGTK